MRQTRPVTPPTIPVWGYLICPTPLLGLLTVFAVGSAIGWMVIDRAKSNVSPLSVNNITAGEQKSKPGEKQTVKGKTFTREEVKDIWNWNRTEEKIQAKLGRPDKTTERDIPLTFRSSDGSSRGGGYEHVVIYHYYGLTIDAKGSGKTDRETILIFGAADDSLQFIP